MEVGHTSLCSFNDEPGTDNDFRDFLLFIPVNTPGLKAVLSYYTSTVTLNAEGDVAISGDTVEGLGTKIQFPTTFIGAIASIASPRRQRVRSKEPFAPLLNKVPQARGMDIVPTQLPVPSEWDVVELLELPPTEPSTLPAKSTLAYWKPVLTDLSPDPGYFLAGGIAGVISRTATAPLDRLKVYLIAQTGVKDEAVHAVKQGTPVQAAKKASRPLIEATKALWKAGGIRSLFAGRSDLMSRGGILIL